ncbi:peptidase domain-containing ABC transporter [Aquimarina sp. MMG016]|uniref:peptidase domain-containing ABC transporter n=1 Tax=Aquimarina sp. MMG016 TaxID=2822690 RepID=UPI001B3A1D8E|nr:peptidase domain-containing ABC transporter [Aquimarina sp. MMG016]MBQ4819273.1 peptidase domain-containing ABC transporter [Aquimarina sp. MMG016]
MSFQFTHQHDNMDCGPACLSMVASSYGKNYPLKYLKDNSAITREGVSLSGIREAAGEIGLDVVSSKISIEDLKANKDFMPCIVHWNQNHFVVLRKISKNLFNDGYTYHVADPAHGVVRLSEENFKKSWLCGDEEGIILFLFPTKEFHEKESVKKEKVSIKYMFSFLKPYRKQLTYMFFLLLIGSGLTLIFPFLTQLLIDKGVNVKDIDFVFLILSAQLGVFLGSITIDIFRNWLMLYVGTHLSITIISDFIKKMLQLPIKFFDTKKKGDFIQRIQDNERIEEFLTSQGLTTLFSLITFAVFFGVFWYYDHKIFLVYLLLTVIAVGWSFFWLKKRKRLDYYRFQQRSEDQESIYEIINGVTEMKINQFEDFKRKEWEKIQQKLFKLNIRILKIDQIQLSGFEFINQLKNILVTFLAATYVVQDKMTLGALLSVSYIIGQMNSPINQLITFFRSLQDAKLSLERLNEVQNHPVEEQEGQKPIIRSNTYKKNGIERGIHLNNVSFRYGGSMSPEVLKDIDLCIPEGKITAIVGASGSGKTTLMKLLLRFYDPTEGQIHFNHDNILDISPKSIRENCGVVMQDGYIFSDTIARNIATGDEDIDVDKLNHAIKIANIENFISSLPLGLKTKIGAAGNGISGGQRQRILIARAVYKNPHYIVFDEATSALDAENEKIIHDNLQGFFKQKTVLIIAHRLSTVKNADQIIVLKNGEIVESGNHQELVEHKADYFNLVKNQLELGN